MTHNHNDRADELNRTTPLHTPRLRLKPKASEIGAVDGAWWPRTDDLTAELPDLLAVLSVRLGRIDRVLYNLSEWATAPVKLAFAGRPVRLDGYRYQPGHSIEVLGLNRDRIFLMIVPAATAPDGAHAAMMAAAGSNNTSTIGDLLTLSLHGRGIPNRPGIVGAQERWESEGGAQMDPRLALSGRTTQP